MISWFSAQFQGLGGDRPKPGECPENEDDDEREWMGRKIGWVG